MQIDVFHDTVCPWCRIGKRHLQLALEHWQGEPVDVRYRSFFLNPDLPPEGHPFLPYMRAKGGGQMEPENFFATPRDRGAAVGLTFNFEQIERAPNSELSHRLIALAPPAHQAAVLEAVYAAYFEHGQDIGDLDVLIGLAEDCGMDPERTRQALLGEAGKAEVYADMAWARRHGITGVPFFVLNQKYAFSGAQPPEVILQALQQAAQTAPV